MGELFDVSKGFFVGAEMRIEQKQPPSAPWASDVTIRLEGWKDGQLVSPIVLIWDDISGLVLSTECGYINFDSTLLSIDTTGNRWSKLRVEYSRNPDIVTARVDIDGDENWDANGSINCSVTTHLGPYIQAYGITPFVAWFDNFNSDLQDMITPYQYHTSFTPLSYGGVNYSNTTFWDRLEGPYIKYDDTNIKLTETGFNVNVGLRADGTIVYTIHNQTDFESAFGDASLWIPDVFIAQPDKTYVYNSAAIANAGASIIAAELTPKMVCEIIEK